MKLVKKMGNRYSLAIGDKSYNGEFNFGDLNDYMEKIDLSETKLTTLFENNHDRYVFTKEVYLCEDDDPFVLFADAHVYKNNQYDKTIICGFHIHKEFNRNELLNALEKCLF